MQIWVDADACPKVIKQILFRTADRVKIIVTFVANSPLWTPASAYIRTIQVGSGFDVADNYIVKKMEHGDLVITADIPLAAEVIEKRGFGINPRGELYTEENIKNLLSVRNFMDELRGSGVNTGGPPAFSMKDRESFANRLHSFLTKQIK